MNKRRLINGDVHYDKFCANDRLIEEIKVTVSGIILIQTNGIYFPLDWQKNYSFNIK